jgi:hypothetical protein
MFRYIVTVVYLALLSVAPSFSGPIIDFDTKSFDCGTVDEDQTDTVSATFTVKNTGDADLRIRQVRPGCGCTTVRFDSVVGPAHVSPIKAKMSIKGYGTGKLSKGITVFSNADNDSLVHLDINVYVRPLVGVSSSYLDLITADTLTSKTVLVTSVKKDLKITSVTFTSNRRKGVGKKKMKIRYNFTPANMVSEDRSYLFKLELFPPVVKKWSAGSFELVTNHEKRKNIILRGRIGR